MRLYVHCSVIDIENWEPLWQYSTYADGLSWCAAMQNALGSIHRGIAKMYSQVELARLAVDTCFAMHPIASPVPEGLCRRVPGLSFALANPGDAR